MAAEPAPGVSLGRPVDVRVALPDDWWVIPLLDPAERRLAEQGLLDRRLAADAGRPLLRAELARALAEQSTAAAESGARLLALSLQVAEGVSLPASMVLHWVDGTAAAGGAGTVLADLEDELRPVPGTEPAGFTLDQARLPSGPTLRRVHVPEVPTGEDPVPSLVADYWVERPDGGGVVQLVFATPLLPLRAAMLDLFDAIAGALRWAYGPRGVL